MHEFCGNIVEYFESPAFCATKMYEDGPPELLSEESLKACRDALKNTQRMSDVQTFMQVRDPRRWPLAA